jgi:hypothetical protein
MVLLRRKQTSRHSCRDFSEGQGGAQKRQELFWQWLCSENQSPERLKGISAQKKG